jgi:hypothetical protein
MRALLDNDILMKGACYGLLSQMFAHTLFKDGEIGILGAARYVISNAIRRKADLPDPEGAVQRLNNFLGTVEIVEPSEDEIAFSADLELAAQRAGLTLDTGESQLCSILIRRALEAIFTGDKRAIIVLESLLDSVSILEVLCGKVYCLEQLFASVTVEETYEDLRASICLHHAVDRALAIAFSCSAPNSTLENISEGLTSYIEDLRKKAPRILAT